MKPQFFLLAGPNGAGKSTAGSHHIKPGLAIFNGDLVFAELQQKYPQLSNEQVAGGVAVALERARDQALEQRSDFAFETNFSSNMAAFIAKLFKEAGYETTLIYFGLNDTDISGLRVKMRVKMGGHYVPPETIRYNFEEGVTRLPNSFEDFDHIRFVDSRNPFMAPVIAYCNKLSGEFKIIDPNVAWFNTHFKNELENHFQLHMQKNNLDPDDGYSGKRGR